MKEDLVLLLSLIDENFQGGLVDSSIREYCDKILKNATFLSIYKQGHIKAFIAYYDNDKKSLIGYLSMLAVHPEHQNKGYGKELLNMAINNLKNKGFKNFDLEVLIENEIAIKLYQSFGFEFVNQTSNKIHMQLIL
ncbi:GNAT family N-acetyltransferase [Seonamhaeicola maritimus]|uniref:GNAT family N-acetyltransferase n=1 Tax=Seonamhaeicola maritimus TaxID=2591822 RepID=A0A5C7GK65_9FLAO|nr:GNAT family N-acetyltransferase [Seonamhaeicola maritimus]TXG38856.1 GNAT family N-acetyltransferase [Seonamhaeicola maritimus]